MSRQDKIQLFSEFLPANDTAGRPLVALGFKGAGMSCCFVVAIMKGPMPPEIRRKLSSQAAPKLVEAGL